MNSDRLFLRISILGISTGVILGAFFLDIWGAETSMKKGFIALGWTALFLVGIFFVDRDREE